MTAAKETKSVALADGARQNGMTVFPSPAEFAMLKEMGNMALKSGFLPSTVNTPEKAVIIMLKGRELGIPPMQAFSSIAVVNGKPTMSAELMLSMVYKNVPGAIVNILETSDKVCTLEAKRPNGVPCKFTFTMQDAEKAKLLAKPGPWHQYPAAMLRARCISAMARAMFPDALSGVVYTPEELGAAVNETGEVIDVKSEIVSAPPAAPSPIKPAAQQDNNRIIGKTQAETLVTACKEHGWDRDMLRAFTKSRFNVEAFPQLRFGQYDETLAAIQSGKRFDEIMGGKAPVAAATEAPKVEDGEFSDAADLPFDEQVKRGAL